MRIVPSRPSLCVGLGLIWAVARGGLVGAAPPADRPAAARDDPAPMPDEAGAAPREEAAKPDEARPAAPKLEAVSPLVAPSPSILAPNVAPIDIATAFRLAGVQNPEVLVARQRVVEAVAFRQFAAVQILPSINLGTNYDTHTGALQQSNGNILSVNRSALYVGAGSNAVAAGTVNIPGLVLQGNIAQGVFAYLTSRQVVIQREFANAAARNDTFLRVGLAYSELTRAEARLAIARLVADEARAVAQLTASYVKVGEEKRSDANRTATELARREVDVQAAEGRVLIASARLAEVLNVDPSVRLHPTDGWVVPAPMVPAPLPLCQEIAIALLRRPELGERRAVIREAFLALEGTKILPFSPTILVGFSAGGFGGGSNLVRPIFGGFGGRTDFDAVAYWSIQNMGFGNLAMIRTAAAHLQTTRFQEIGVMDRIRAEVAEANAKALARFAQIGTAESAVRSALLGFQEDLARARGAVGLPIEVLDSLRLLARARNEYLDAIVDFNRAQYELYVAMGQPPADALARPALAAGSAPTSELTASGRTVPPAAAPAPAPAPAAAPPAGRGPFAPAPAAAGGRVERRGAGPAAE